MPVVVVQGGDIFSSKMRTLVNPVNCVGVMGAGLAREFKIRYPEMYREYVAACCAGRMQLGFVRAFYYMDKIIVSFPTKWHYAERSELNSILKGIKDLRVGVRPWGLESLAVPALGCGYGGLNWEEVADTFIAEFATFECPVELYAPVKKGPNP